MANYRVSTDTINSNKTTQGNMMMMIIIIINTLELAFAIEPDIW
jgi:hypothetical protein